MNYALIEINNLSFSYSDKKNIINDISLNINKNETIALVGANGSGKTTFLYLIAGVLKPESGFIKIKDNEVKYKAYNPDLGFVFQSSDDMLFSPTVFEDISFELMNKGCKKPEIEQKVNTLLENLGLLELKNRAPQHLSGGEKRLVSLASVLITDPAILLFDEPNSDLDMKARRDLITIINNLNVTKVISSHDLEFILETCEKTILLKDGTVLAFGESKKLLSDEKLMEECHQEVPYSLRKTKGKKVKNSKLEK